MKKLLIIFFLCHLSIFVKAQNLNDLSKHEIGDKFYYSNTVRESADKIISLIVEAEKYFKNLFKISPSYTLLVLNPEDWKRYAHPNAVYGIPHYNNEQLIVAGEDNEFWKRNIPTMNLLPQELAEEYKNAYTVENGNLSLQAGFNLLAIHELGHAFQNAAGIIKQSNWLNELFSNIMLHTFIAQKNPDLLPQLTLFPKGIVHSIKRQDLKFTDLADFDLKYNEIAQFHPMNYGWYQSNFHIKAAEFYEQAGEQGMINLWNTLKEQKDVLTSDSLISLLEKENTFLGKIIHQW